MIYIELQLDGKVRIHEMNDNLTLLRVSVDARAQLLAPPLTISEAHDYIRTACYQLETFDSLAEAEDWAEAYHGFRCAEVRAELTRFELRRASLSALGVVAAA